MNDPIPRAVELLRLGQLVAFATETVYGLGADATNPDAVQRIFDAKGRPSTNPLIVHIADVEIAKTFVAVWPDSAEKLARAFWPGPLTLVLPKSPRIASSVTAGRGTVALRVPNHPLALQLLQAFGGAVAAPSANRSNHISPTSAADVRAELGNRVDLILDGGPCVVGIESTVLDLTAQTPIILRPGAITQQQIESVIGPVSMFQGSVEITSAAPSPGQHSRHYSPNTPALRFERPDRPRVLQSHRGIALLIGSANQAPQAHIIEMPEDPDAYARLLYQTLRAADSKAAPAILIELPPNQPRWTAVRDRLIRATLPLAPDAAQA